MSNIYKKMSDITSELSAVAKNLEVSVGKNSYKAVGEADVLAAVKPLESKHGVYSYPSSRRIVESMVMKTADSYGRERQYQFVRIETEYTFVNIDKPEETIVVTSYGDGVDSQDKAAGKAMTYSDKYALLKAYKIITGEDPDQNASQEGTFEKPKQEKAKPEKTAFDNPPPLPATDAQIDYIKRICEVAGITPKEVFHKLGIKGKTLTIDDFYKMKRYIESEYANVDPL